MKYITSTIALCAACASLIFSSCSDKAEFVGSWKASSAVSLNAPRSGATVASLSYIDFFEPVEKSDGTVKLSNEYFVSEPVIVDSVASATAQMQFTAVVSVAGSWTYDIDDKDDLLLSFDLPSVNVDLVSDNVSIDGELTEDMRDSIVARLIPVWKGELTRDFQREMSRYSVVDDVEVSKDGSVMTLEVHSPEAKIHFRRVIP
ncbi:MAG: hypothetical protein NC127_07350 [Muribaculum sp.]|nr:hypothetical protein [Muribaculum sp.]